MFFKKCPFVSWFRILSQYGANISFLYVLACNAIIPFQVSSFKIYVIKPKGFLGYPTRGIACALNIPNN
jgi:hypothetical protein